MFLNLETKKCFLSPHSVCITLLGEYVESWNREKPYLHGWLSWTHHMGKNNPRRLPITYMSVRFSEGLSVWGLLVCYGSRFFWKGCQFVGKVTLGYRMWGNNSGGKEGTLIVWEKIAEWLNDVCSCQVLEGGEEQGKQGENKFGIQREGGLNMMGICILMISWEFSQKNNFLEGFMVNLINFRFSSSASLSITAITFLFRWFQLFYLVTWWLDIFVLRIIGSVRNNFWEGFGGLSCNFAKASQGPESVTSGRWKGDWLFYRWNWTTRLKSYLSKLVSVLKFQPITDLINVHKVVYIFNLKLGDLNRKSLYLNMTM